MIGRGWPADIEDASIPRPPRPPIRVGLVGPGGFPSHADEDMRPGAMLAAPGERSTPRGATVSRRAKEIAGALRDFAELLEIGGRETEAVRALVDAVRTTTPEGDSSGLVSGFARWGGDDAMDGFGVDGNRSASWETSPDRDPFASASGKPRRVELGRWDLLSDNVTDNTNAPPPPPPPPPDPTPPGWMLPGNVIIPEDPDQVNRGLDAWERDERRREARERQGRTGQPDPDGGGPGYAALADRLMRALRMPIVSWSPTSKQTPTRVRPADEKAPESGGSLKVVVPVSLDDSPLRRRLSSDARPIQVERPEDPSWGGER